MSEPKPTIDTEDSGHGIKSLIRDLLRLDRTALVVLATVPFVLTLLEYYGMPWHYSRHREVSSMRPPVRHMQSPEFRNPPFVKELGDIEMPGKFSLRLHRYMWWALGCIVFLVLIPILIAWLVGRQSPRALGVRFRGTLKEAPTYLLLYLIFLPVIYFVSLRPEFQQTYPFFKPRPGEGITEEFVIFELLYFSQFFAIEFFFRGFMVLGLKKSIGRAAILVMLAPYCMIHYYKPMPEALGAIGAGLVLGTLSYRSGTIIYGWFLHFAVALTMDLLALHHRGLL